MNSSTVLNSLISQGLVAKTQMGRAFRLVQTGTNLKRAINTTVVLAADEMTRTHQMRQIKEAVRHYMGVEIKFTHFADEYWTATAPVALAESKVAAPDFVFRD